MREHGIRRIGWRGAQPIAGLLILAAILAMAGVIWEWSARRSATVPYPQSDGQVVRNAPARPSGTSRVSLKPNTNRLSIAESPTQAAKIAPDASVREARALRMLATRPLIFEANEGQVDSRVKYLSHERGYTLFLTRREAVLALAGARSKADSSGSTASAALKEMAQMGAALSLKFVGSSASAQIAGEDLQRSQTNYFLGADRSQWLQGLPNYSAVEYAGIYPGINALFHGSGRRLEFDLRVSPGADSSKAELEIGGAKKLSLDMHGNIVVSAPDHTELLLGKPLAYQEVAGTKREIAANFVVRGANRIGFSLGPYDRSLPLVIDPTFTLSYSTYLGGTGYGDKVNAIAIGPGNSAYLAGTTNSQIFPATTPQIPYPPSPNGAYQTSCEACVAGFTDAFVAKFDGDQNLLYYTYLGPTTSNSAFYDELGYTTANGIAVDSAGNAYVAGRSNAFSGLFPTTASSGQSGYAFVSELSDVDSNGNPQPQTLLNSTLLAGESNQDSANGIALDGQGNVYVVGTTTITGLATASAAQKAPAGFQSAFVAKINFNNPSILSFFTYVLGGSSDVGSTIAIGSNSGNVYVGGTTQDAVVPVSTFSGQTNFPYSASRTAGFVAGLNSSGSSFTYFSYLGGTSASGSTAINALTLDPSEDIYATGHTTENDFLTTSGTVGDSSTVCSSGRCPAGFVAEFTPNTSGTSSMPLVTYVGGLLGVTGTPAPPATTGNGIALDAAGDIFVTGGVATTDFPEPGESPSADAYLTALPCHVEAQSNDNACESAFLLELSPGATSVAYSTYLGGEGVSNFVEDSADGIALDDRSNVYVVGSTNSGNFPTVSVSNSALIATSPNSIDGAGFFAVFKYPTNVSGILFSPAEGNFGTTPGGQTPTPITLTVTNAGLSPLNIASWTVASPTIPNPFFVAPNSCAYPVSFLPPLFSCNFTISFTPAAAGVYSGTITFVDNAPQGVPDPNNPGEYDQTYIIAGTSSGSGGAPPTVTTLPATTVGSSSAILNGTVSPNGSATTAYFQYGLDTTYGRSTQSQSLGSGSSATPVSANISSLAAATLYHFRIVASNSASPATYGADQTFTTTLATAAITSFTGPSSATYGQSVTLTAAVAPTSGTGTPTGTVTFSNGSTSLATLPLTGTTATFTTTSLPVGPLVISAVYNGDSNFGSSQPATWPINIIRASAVISSFTGPSSAAYGQSVTLAAIVAASSGIGTPTGTVTFSNAGNVVGTVSLTGATASLTTNSLPAGPLVITAVYNGDSNFSPSQPATLSISIAAPPPPPSVATYPTSPVNLGSTEAGSTSKQQLLVTNSAPAGSSSFTVQSATISPSPSPFSVTGVSNCTNPSINNFPFTLAPGESCDIDLQFAPLSNSGELNATLQIVDTAANSNVAGTSTSGVTQRILLLQGNGALVSNGQMIIIAGAAVGAEVVSCPPPGQGVCLGTSTLGYRGVGCRTLPFVLPASPIPICNAGYGGDGKQALSAMLTLPMAVAADKNGNVYVADSGNLVVRKIDPSGDISTAACIDPTTGQIDYSGCQLPNSNAPFYLDPSGWPIAGSYISAVAVDGNGNLHAGLASAGTGQGGTIAMTSDPNGNVYALNTGGGGGFDVTITMNGNTLLSTQAGTLPFDATFAGLAADASGNLYTVGTSGSYTGDLIEISPTGSISVVLNEAGQNLLANMAANGLAMDASGNFYFLVNSAYSTEGSALVEEYSPATQTFTVIAGTGTNGFNNGNAPSDGSDFTNLADLSLSVIDAPMPAVLTDLNNAIGIAIGPNGAIYIADTGNDIVRRVVLPANTPTGSPVSVTPVDVTSGTTPVTVTFSSVSQAGVTSLVTSVTGPASPAGFQLGTGGVYYDISTTAVYTPPATVCISFAAGSFPVGSPQLFHYTNGDWVNVTNPGYPTSTTVCGNVSSFSPFALFEATGYSAAQVSSSASGLLYSRVSKTFSGTVTITNTSGATLNGPLQIVLSGLPSGVTLLNAAGSFSGNPYITVSSASLAAGQSATVAVQFSDPSMTKITFTPTAYSGSF